MVIIVLFPVSFVTYIWINIGSRVCARLTHSNDYKKNICEIEIWQCVTELEKKKAGPVIYLLWEGKARKACERIDVKALKADDGVNVLTNKLKELYARDTEQATYIAYQELDRYQWKQRVSLSDYINEFERLNDRIKKCGMEMPDAVLVYWLLINASISEEKQQRLARKQWVN